MARYIGPKTKIARKFGIPIFGEDKYLEKKKYPPGQHGINKRRSKRSEYAIQLLEKQKAKYIYGILEKQFSNIYKKANSSKGITGEVLLQLCESRLDNVVFRLGIAKSRTQARQLVSHKHIKVNAKIVNIPSYILKNNDKITIKESSKDMITINESLSVRGNYDWLIWNDDIKEGIFLKAPERSQIPEDIKEQLIVELYSK